MTGLLFVYYNHPKKKRWKIYNIAFSLGNFIWNECQQEITINKMKYLVKTYFTNIIDY